MTKKEAKSQKMKTEEQRSIDETIMFLSSTKRNVQRYGADRSGYSIVYVLDLINHVLSILDRSEQENVK